MESRVERSRDEDLLRRVGHRGGVAGGNVWRVCCATAVYNASWEREERDVSWRDSRETSVWKSIDVIIIIIIYV